MPLATNDFSTRLKAHDRRAILYVITYSTDPGPNNRRDPFFVGSPNIQCFRCDPAYPLPVLPFCSPWFGQHLYVIVSPMAFRIHDSVVRGEIDNRLKGAVRGRIWLAGRAEPLTLELHGNAHPDLAGCLLTFVNSLAPIRHPDFDLLTSLQRGVAGDLTAARKVRVSPLPVDRADAIRESNEQPPEALANSLYLEWFSQTSGRVVIESANYELTISAPEWKLTWEEEEHRARDVALAMQEFTTRLTNAIDQHKRGQKPPEAAWNEHDYERLLRESDARTDKYMELLDKYGTSDEADAEIAHQMGWDREPNEEQAEEERERIEEMNRACEEALHEPLPEPEAHREGIDWIRTTGGDLRHPLQHRCFKSAMGFWHETEARGLQKLNDEELEKFLFEFQTTSVKLGGALNGLARGFGCGDAAFTVACLKRALDHLHKSQAALEAVAPKELLPREMLTEARRELFELRQGILKLMDEFRRDR